MFVIDIPEGSLVENPICIRYLEEDHRIRSGRGRLPDTRHELSHWLIVLEGVTAADQISRQMGVILIEELTETGHLHIGRYSSWLKARIDSETASARPTAKGLQE